MSYRTLADLLEIFEKAETHVTLQPPAPDLELFTELRRYRDVVLPRELQEISGRPQGAPPRRPRLLVLLCGTSPAPLLLSYCYHQPEQVLLVGSESLGVNEDLRSCLPSDALTPELIVPDSQPLVAYQALFHKLRTYPADSVLLDVTGSKKTMMIAAFLVAARLGIKMTYVDATQTSAVLNLPVPGTSAIIAVEDPITVYQLHELEKAAALFCKHRYDAAAEHYDLIATKLDTPALARLVDPAQVRAAAERARGASAWREGNYAKAEAHFRAAGWAVPVPVARLAALWRTYPDENERHRLLAVKDSGAGLLRFAADRLAWALRQTTDNQRDAFVIAFQACDTALEGLCMNLAQRGRWPEPGTTRRGDQLLRDAVKGGWFRAGHGSIPALGEPYQLFSQEVGSGRDRKEALREHRNVLVHRIGSHDPALGDKLLKGAPSLAERLLRAIGQALPLPDAQAKTIMDEALADPQLVDASLPTDGNAPSP